MAIKKYNPCLLYTSGSTVLTEVPEMFGAETILMNRCVNEEVFDKTVSLINDFKDYFTSHNQVVYENPSPGNKKGGITTLEDKSLGCVQKSGSADVEDVIEIGGSVTRKGLNLLTGPGNDIVAVTNLTASGCHLILFSTGRGTPVGAPVPTVKIATNTNLAKRKPHWIDFNAVSYTHLVNGFFCFFFGHCEFLRVLRHCNKSARNVIFRLIIAVKIVCVNSVNFILEQFF